MMNTSDHMKTFNNIVYNVIYWIDFYAKLIIDFYLREHLIIFYLP